MAAGYRACLSCCMRGNRIDTDEAASRYTSNGLSCVAATRRPAVAWASRGRRPASSLQRNRLVRKSSAARPMPFRLVKRHRESSQRAEADICSRRQRARVARKKARIPVARDGGRKQHPRAEKQRWRRRRRGIIAEANQGNRIVESWPAGGRRIGPTLPASAWRYQGVGKPLARK